jgi:hypothetical protein
LSALTGAGDAAWAIAAAAETQAAASHLRTSGTVTARFS